jgi:phage terminase large subunit
MKRCLAFFFTIGLVVINSTAHGDGRINLNQALNYKHGDLFKSIDSELLVYGGAGAGKSYSIADKLLLQGIINTDRQKTVIIRKTLASLRKTTLDILERRAETLHISLKIDRQGWTAKAGNMEFILTGMNNREDYQKIKSLTDVNFIWVNEVTELREDDYKQLLLRLRGSTSSSKYAFRQIVSDFNPVGKTSWVHDRFWVRLPESAKKLRYTVFDNPWAEPEYVERLKATAADDKNFYNIYFLGEWGELEGIIFPNWDVVPLPDMKFDEIFYGGDFGYSIDPAVLVKIYRKADEFWLQELIYRTGFTNPMLAAEAKDLGIQKHDDTYWDSAEPKSIQELCDNGLNAKPSAKGPDSLKAGIDYLKSKTIHIVEGSVNGAKEQKSYIWKKDKDGRSLPVPIGINDHFMAASRYGIFTHCKADTGAFYQSEKEFY